MQKMGLIYDGKSKKMYATDDPNLLIAQFKDDMIAFRTQNKSIEIGKGALNNKISAQIFKILREKGIATHFVEAISDNEQLIKRCEILPLEIIVRNIATGSISKRLGLSNGMSLPGLVEFYYKNDELNDPLVTDEHCLAMGLVRNENDLEMLRHISREVNTILSAFFESKRLKLVDFKIEFGIDKDANILLSDEISPDSLRLWDMDSDKKFEKDGFAQGTGEITLTYQEILNRILS